jgi:hypothetical protein
VTVAKPSTLAQALVAAQAEMPAVKKTGKGNYSEYVTLDHLINETRKHLAAHGFAITQFPMVLETGQPALRTILIHESGERLEADQPLFLGEKKTMQELGKAVTYARRYGWSAVLGISTEVDDDAASISTTSATEPKPEAAANGAAVISPAQRKRLWAIAKEQDPPVPDELVKTIVLEIGGVESTQDIPRDRYDAVIGALQAQEVPF